MRLRQLKHFNQEQVLALAKLPSKQELLAQMVGSIKAPIAGFVNVLSGNLRGLVRVLEAIRGSK
jgi:large subunit ribosomal protein L10